MCDMTNTCNSPYYVIAQHIFMFSNVENNIVSLPNIFLLFSNVKNNMFCSQHFFYKHASESAIEELELIKSCERLYEIVLF